MEQFSLEKWLQDKSRKVVTRDGRPVRIICWDAENSKPIVALVLTRSVSQRQFDELTISYFNDGTYYGGAQEDLLDLFFADEENTELTEFEKELQIIISEASRWTSDDGSMSTCCQFGDKEIKKISAQLLDLARNEIEKGNPCSEKPKQDWSEDDEKMIVAIVKHFKNEEENGLLGTYTKTPKEIVQWIKSIKDRVQPQPKQEWSENDEKFFKTALWHISYSVSNGKSTDIHCDTTDWLKSIKSNYYHWKPSIEQLNALKQHIGGYFSEEADKKLETLYNDLKKL